MKNIKINGETVKVPELAFRCFGILKKFKQKVLKSIGHHDNDMCPMNQAFGINAEGEWSYLSTEDREKITRQGITKPRYNEFIKWYDGDWDGVESGDSEKALKVFLKKGKKVIVKK